MNAVISPGKLSGTVRAIGSKSDIHRKLICAALSEVETVIHGVTASNDVLATLNCLRAMGAEVALSGTDCTVKPGKPAQNPHFDCGESGSTLRFLLPAAAAFCGGGTFTGSGRLPERPLSELIEAMKSGGAMFDSERLPLTACGRLTPGEYRIPGNVSSQYISGLLMALAVTTGESVIRLTTPLESARYVDMTVDTLRQFGAEIHTADGSFSIRGRGRLTSPGEISADGDWSNAAFFLTAGAVGNSVTVTGLDMDSIQGDRQIVDIMGKFGANVNISGSSVTVSPGELQGCDIDLTHIPDLLPILAVLAADARGETRFTGGVRLRIKESDRLKTVAEMINDLGGSARELPDGLIVRGTGLTGGTVDGAYDHRIVMAAAAAGTVCKSDVTILGSQAVNKSYPEFFRDFSDLGGKASGIDIR